MDASCTLRTDDAKATLAQTQMLSQVCNASAFAIDAASERLIATMTGTLMAVFERTGVSG